jgi:phosphotransferase system HPr-like phosphotransfer protein
MSKRHYKYEFRRKKLGAFLGVLEVQIRNLKIEVDCDTTKNNKAVKKLKSLVNYTMKQKL